MLFERLLRIPPRAITKRCQTLGIEETSVGKKEDCEWIPWADALMRAGGLRNSPQAQGRRREGEASNVLHPVLGSLLELQQEMCRHDFVSHPSVCSSSEAERAAVHDVGEL